ncbi:CDP-diacylglycerol--serine O-phosphatidyltransferase [Helicobacter ailurogastricus]|uniref:CDP-diacylglycerol--serine O-phosphatidyltransferase n=1 Tax=Helicobacter ailurogastricus TaxID=1578720 RepID=A0A0K2Y3K7_9HELI|nr:CDP-diacylglycerol--serine O-phosphatidyltransferase [Helicobacter ailurogastricus]BDQ29556.1 CDP-diacylglycerol--serine O-phosphatidyltransferase [Helicobacter ailurogastricus]CRF52424.1 CDP-diacylglycerol--serine O-phosphatidyltransferase [Helicobacter ailurogastricus]
MKPLYLFPNLFTASSIFLGVMAMLHASHGEFIVACWMVVGSLVLDGLDGRIARLTNTTSKFGLEFDSLADAVAFGVAPSLIAYFYVGHFYGRWGMAACALFVIFGAIRLARFNVTTQTTDPYSFIGIPIPSAAVLVVLGVLIDTKYGILRAGWGKFFLAYTVFLGVLMVSNIRYPNFKKVQWNLKLFVLLLLLLLLLFVRPLEVLGAFMFGYLFYGLARWVFLMARIVFKHK